MKRIAVFVLTVLFMLDARADFVATGTITRFHVGGGNVAIYLSSTAGCPTQWYYAFRADVDADTWKTLVALAMFSYAQGKTVSIFHSSGVCTEQRFYTIDTVN